MEVEELIRSHPMTEERPWWLGIDLAMIRDRVRRLHAAFGDHVLHAPAIKACNLVPALEAVIDAGAGLEAASFGEVELAVAAGCAPENIVFDSPARTRRELLGALDLGVTINADNLAELARIAALRRPEHAANIGLRINPETGPGDIAALSVATRNAKFGVSMSRRRDEILDAFSRYDWLDGIHVHTGSQGMGLDALVAGVRCAVDLATEVGAARVDIGGGLPVAYRPGEHEPSASDYVDALGRDVPELTSFDVVTEFGRWVFAHAGVAVSRVEYVKPAADHDVATIHFGADLLLRRAYAPQDWYHEIEVFTPGGVPKTSDERRYTVAGPLCFSGDVLAESVALPAIEEGDLIVVRDVGAYTFSMWSDYCSRPRPAFVVHDGADARELPREGE